MLQINSSDDPIVEILRLAYRRGLAIRQEQDKRKTVNFASNRSDGQDDTNTTRASALETSDIPSK
jgi:hypothetical protein